MYWCVCVRVFVVHTSIVKYAANTAASASAKTAACASLSPSLYCHWPRLSCPTPRETITRLGSSLASNVFL